MVTWFMMVAIFLQVSTWERARDFASSAVLIGGIAYAAYQLYKVQNALTLIVLGRVGFLLRNIIRQTIV